jgi:hypothetical protein
MAGEVTGASLATFVLPNSECSLAASGLPGGRDVLAFIAIAGTLTDGFFPADFHGIQCLCHTAPATVTISAAVSSVRRKTPPRKSGVKFPRARSRRLAFGGDMVKSNEGVGSCTGSAIVNCLGTRACSLGMDFTVRAMPGAWSDPLLEFDSVPGTSTAASGGKASGTAAGTSAC